MEKHKRVNAFTLIESLFVLLIISILTLSIQMPDASLNIFIKRMQMYFIICQEQAFMNKEEVDILINRHEALFGDIVFEYPDTIHCSTQSFHYNEQGNISKANTISCTNGKDTKKLVFQLGSGRVRIDE